MRRIHLVLVLALALGAGLLGSIGPPAARASSRDVLLEDLRIEPVQSAIYHQAERPGKVVRIVPWVEKDGGYRLLAVTELGWVFESGDDPGQWTLVGQIVVDPVGAP